MADISITSSAVVPDSEATVLSGVLDVAGGVNPGDIVAPASDGTIVKAQATSATLAAAVGVVVNIAGDGQIVYYVSAGLVTIQAAAFSNLYEPLVVSANAGNIAPIGDLTSGTHYLTYLGWATAANRIMVNIDATGGVYGVAA